MTAAAAMGGAELVVAGWPALTLGWFARGAGAVAARRTDLVEANA